MGEEVKIPGSKTPNRRETSIIKFQRIARKRPVDGVGIERWRPTNSNRMIERVKFAPSEMITNRSGHKSLGTLDRFFEGKI